MGGDLARTAVGDAFFAVAGDFRVGDVVLGVTNWKVKLYLIFF